MLFKVKTITNITNFALLSVHAYVLVIYNYWIYIAKAIRILYLQQITTELYIYKLLNKNYCALFISQYGV